jgi:hypothetical protein
MQAYYITGSNLFTFRTEQLATTSNLMLELQDMYTLTNTSQSIISASYNQYESLLSFTASIASASVASEYRATILSGSTPVWHGSIQVYDIRANEPKSTYENQNTQYKSIVSDNEYIIIEN